MSPRLRRVDYVALKAAERVALVLRAEARGDHDDRRRLMHDAPIMTYRITEPAIMDRLGDARRLVEWWFAVERPVLADAAVVGLMVETLPRWVGTAGDAASWQLFTALTDNGVQGGEGEMDELLGAAHEAVRESFDALLGALKERERSVLGTAVAARAALDEVSRRLFGVDGATLIAAILPGELQTTISAEVAPDGAVVAEMVEVLLGKLAPEAEP
jgi:hypothetical protein